ncbi:MAG: hypothetical protein DMG17_33640 [Acidobacteria bacterium]|nr:MAG: hypothetical protein DMG17_33640 [Acidobacteriota bacterium]
MTLINGSRREFLKTMAAAGAGLLPGCGLLAQSARQAGRNNSGRIDVHHHFQTPELTGGPARGWTPARSPSNRWTSMASPQPCCRILETAGSLRPMRRRAPWRGRSMRLAQKSSATIRNGSVCWPLCPFATSREAYERSNTLWNH